MRFPSKISFSGIQEKKDLSLFGAPKDNSPSFTTNELIGFLRFPARQRRSLDHFGEICRLSLGGLIGVKKSCKTPIRSFLDGFFGFPFSELTKAGDVLDTVTLATCRA